MHVIALQLIDTTKFIMVALADKCLAAYMMYLTWLGKLCIICYETWLLCFYFYE